MARYLTHRILATIPVALIVAFIVFSLLYVTPGDPAQVIAGDAADLADIQKIRELLGMDQPYLLRFGHWLLAIAHGDLGTSLFSQTPVADLILQRLAPTLSLSVAALLLTLLMAIPTGIVAALYVGRWPDKLTMIMAILGYSVPVFVVGYFLILGFSVELRIFPVQGFKWIDASIGPFLSHLVLPSIALSLVLTALVTRITRTSMLEVLDQDYIRTARSKGLSGYTVIVRHALRNAAIPIVTVLGLTVGMLITGVVVTETVFAIPGLGRLVIDAIVYRDYPVIQGVILVLSFVYLFLNLLVDISYTLLDPRVRY